MSCNCANRMRSLLEKMEYKKENEIWVKGESIIKDIDIEDHHTRETIKLMINKIFK